MMREIAAVARRQETAAGAHAFCQFAAALMAAGGDQMQAVKMFQAQHPQSVHLATVLKAGVFPLTTYDSDTSPLVAIRSLAAAFISLIRPQTILGKLIGVRQVPFDIQVSRATAGTQCSWIGEGAAIPASRMSFDDVTLERLKIGGITGFSKELARSSDPAAEEVIRADLTASCIAYSDTAFIDQSIGAVPNVSPASITHDATAISSTGSTVAAFDDDLQNAIDVLLDAGIRFLAPYWILSPSLALRLATLRGTGGVRAFPDVTILGGLLLGVPVIVSAAAGNTIILLDSGEVLFADGGIEIDASLQAAVQLQDNPLGTASAVVTSLWHSGLVGIRILRFMNWLPRRPGAVAIITGSVHHQTAQGDRVLLGVLLGCAAE
jgi:HK97 family phage major capsid protein